MRRARRTTCCCWPGWTRSGRCEQRPVDLLEVAADTVRDAHVRVPDPVRASWPGWTTTSDTFEPVTVLGDEHGLRQVATNLVGQRAAAHPRRRPGHGAGRAPGPPARPPAGEPCGGRGHRRLTGPLAVFEVTDTGPGMPPPTRRGSSSGSTVPTPAAPAARAAPGWACPSSRRSCTAHGGWVELCDRAGPGRRFRVLLPAHRRTTRMPERTTRRDSEVAPRKFAGTSERPPPGSACHASLTCGRPNRGRSTSPWARCSSPVPSGRYQTVRGGTAASAASSCHNAVPRGDGATGPVTETVSANGTVASASTASANFVTSGTVTEIDVKVGDTWSRRARCSRRIDPAAANDAAGHREGQPDAAQANRDRAVAAGATPPPSTSAKAQVTNAQGTVDTAQAAVERLRADGADRPAR